VEISIDARSRARSMLAGAMALLVVLAGCGGGSGGGSPGAGPAPVPPPVEQPTGLVPAAPQPGAVLYTDASVLRPQRAGAVWHYRGTDRPYGAGSAPTIYTNDVMQVQAGAGPAEQSSDPLHTGPDTSGLTVNAGAVATSSTLDFSGTPEVVSLMELRSPVRVNDQFTVFERHYDDAGTDYDFDGKHDSLDVAMYALVIGQEQIDLQNARGVLATRVDTVLLARVRYSSKGAYSDVVQFTQSRWYAPGIGIVRTRGDQPGPNILTTRHVTDESLVTWDGLTGGLGPMAIVNGTVPSGPSAGKALTTPLDAVAFSDHALVVTDNFDNTFALSQLDLRGNVQLSTNFSKNGLVISRLVRTGNEARLIAYDNTGLWMLPFGSSGAAQLSAPVLLAGGTVVKSVDAIGPQAGSNSTALWAMWLEQYDLGGGHWVVDIKARAFAASGQPVGPAVLLAGGVPAGAVYHPVLSVSNDRVLASWQAMEAGTLVTHLALIDAGAPALLAQSTLAGAAQEAVLPLSDAGRLYAIWDLGPADGRLVGVALDALLNPILPIGQAAGDQFITPTWLQRSEGYERIAGDNAGAVVIAHATYGTYWPEDSLDSTFTNVSEITAPSGQPLAATTPRLLGRVPSEFGLLQIELVFGDRVLLLGGTRNNTLTAVPVWRHL
jgi:hypothetical protein